MSKDTKQSARSDAARGRVRVDGTVVRSTGSWYNVVVGTEIIPSKLRGRLRLLHKDVTNPVAVGDRVSLLLNDDGTALITEIGERRNKLARRAAGRKIGVEHVIVSNVDLAWVVQSVREPKLNPGFIDRFLVMAALHNIEAAIVINKIDLMRASEQPMVDRIVALYEGLGYRVVTTSARTGDGIDILAVDLKGHLSVFAGASGVGKSSLLNAIDPALHLRTEPISAKTTKGKHATTNAAFVELAGGGVVVDTPGLREFGVIDIAPRDLCHFFVEFQPYISACRYPDCTHDHEPECAVIDAVDDGKISEARWNSYLNILGSLQSPSQFVGR